MGKQRLPAAVFGKSEESNDQFKLLWCDHDFPDIAQQALDALRSGFQFKGSRENARYKPCYAIWPTKDNQGWIAARFLDAGEDSLGRPHTLRIEAVYLGASDLADAALYLSPENWPTPDTFLSPGTATFDANFSEQELLERLLANAGGQRRPSVFRVFEDSSSYGGFQIVIDEHARTIRKTAPPRITSATNPMKNTKSMSTPTTKNSRWMRPLLAGIVLAGIPGVLAWKNAHDKLRDSQRDVSALQKDLSELEESLGTEKQARKIESNDLKKERDGAKEELKNKEEILGKYEEILKENKIDTEALNKLLSKLRLGGSARKEKYSIAEKRKQITQRIRILLDDLDKLEQSEKPIPNIDVNSR